MTVAEKEISAAHTRLSDKMRDLPDNFLDCRDPGLRHSWQREKDFHVYETTTNGKVASIARSEVCSRCTASKMEKFIVGRYGLEKVGSNSYVYPEGFLLTDVPRGVKKAQVVWGVQYDRAMQAVALTVKTERAAAAKTPAKKATIKTARKTPARR